MANPNWQSVMRGELLSNYKVYHILMTDLPIPILIIIVVNNELFHLCRQVTNFDQCGAQIVNEDCILTELTKAKSIMHS